MEAGSRDGLLAASPRGAGAPAASSSPTRLPAHGHAASGAEAPAETVELVALPRLAVAALRSMAPRNEPVPEVLPAEALHLGWRLQSCTTALLALGISCFLGVIVEMRRSFLAYDTSYNHEGRSHCNATLRLWLLGECCALFLGAMGLPCCAVPATVCVFLGGWATWGVFMVMHSQADEHSKCGLAQVLAVKELVIADYAFLVGVAVAAGLAGAIALTLHRLLLLAYCEREPWDPEEHLLTLGEEADALECGERAPSRGGDEEAARLVGPPGRECAVCWNDFGESPRGIQVSLKACGHRYHRDCILPWLQDHRTCPICRQRADRPPAPTRDQVATVEAVRPAE